MTEYFFPTIALYLAFVLWSDGFNVILLSIFISRSFIIIVARQMEYYFPSCIVAGTLAETFMKNYEGRHIDLKNKVNAHLKKLTGQDIDFFSKLKQSDLVELKTVLADINNLLTFQMTIAAANWICEYFKLNESTKIENINKVDNTKPNTKGYDIQITTPYKIIAEVKCISPVNNGGIFGVAQHDSIMNDIDKLYHGKGSFKDTTDFYKFIFLIDLGERTHQAISQLIKETKGKSPTAQKYNYLKKDKIALLNDKTDFSVLDIEKVYLKKILIK